MQKTRHGVGWLRQIQADGGEGNATLCQNRNENAKQKAFDLLHSVGHRLLDHKTNFSNEHFPM